MRLAPLVLAGLGLAGPLHAEPIDRAEPADRAEQIARRGAELVDRGELREARARRAMGRRERRAPLATPAGEGSFEQLRVGERDVTIYLPAGYADHPDRRYPVIYMQDGQNLFGGGAFGSWDVHRAIEAETQAGRAEQVIVVGVHSPPDHFLRLDEYSPWHIEREGGGGKGDAYVGFVADELRPLINDRYRTKQGRRDTAISGSSLGGLIAVHAGFTRPEVFGKVLAFSPSVRLGGKLLAPGVVEGGLLLDEVKAARLPKLKLYLDSGGSGWLNDDKDNVFRLRDALADKGLRFGHSLWHWFEPGHEHNEAAWRERFPRAFRALFPAR